MTDYIHFGPNPFTEAYNGDQRECGSFYGAIGPALWCLAKPTIGTAIPGGSGRSGTAFLGTLGRLIHATEKQALTAAWRFRQNDIGRCT
jgi:hypothetical protein